MAFLFSDCYGAFHNSYKLYRQTQSGIICSPFLDNTEMALHCHLESIQCSDSSKLPLGLKFIYSEKAPKFYKISIIDLSYVVTPQCWTEGRSSTAVAEDFRPTATATVAEV